MAFTLGGRSHDARQRPFRPASARVFALGCIAVTAGILFHQPMFVMARRMGYRLRKHADRTMTFGIVVIVVDVLVAA